MMITRDLWQLGPRRVCEFLLTPSLELGAGWEQELLPGGLKCASLNAQAHRFVSRFIARRMQLAPLPTGIQDSLDWHIALLTPDILDRYRCRLGAALAAQEVRLAIARDQVEAYRCALGEDLYAFILQRLPLLCPPADAETATHGASQIMSAVRAVGRLALRDLCPGLWPRIELKLPRETNADRETAAGRQLPGRESLRRIASRILRESAP